MPFMLRYLLSRLRSAFAARSQRPKQSRRAASFMKEQATGPRIIGWDKIASGRPSERNGFGCKPDLGFDPRATSTNSRHWGGGGSVSDSRFGHGSKPGSGF
jgi:hypothetical protein